MQHFPLTEKLHTDILEEKYGLIHAEVLKHNSKIRESLLSDSNNVARTYAITFLEKWNNKEIKKINESIRKGASIGKEFRNKGYIIRKNVLGVFIIKIPSWLRNYFETKENYAKARLSEFYAKKEGSEPIIYGVVTEVYSPDFRKPKINQVDKLQIGAVTKCLEKNGFNKEEIYRRIGDDNNYEDFQKQYEKAKEDSIPIILELKSRIQKELLSSR